MSKKFPAILYEDYHRNRKNLKSIINDDDFTYHTLQYFINKYLNNGLKVLDVGCGVGAIDFYLASKKFKVKGIDISKRVIKQVRKNARIYNLDHKATFNVMNFPHEFPKTKFDVVICSEVLEHFEDDHLAIIKLRELLNKKGIIISSSPSINAPLYRLGLLNKFDRSVGHIRRYSLDKYAKLFKDNKFKVIEIKKTEGILRNFLFTFKIGGLLLKILNKKPFARFVTNLDNKLLSIFGESNIYLIATKK
jgi:2-polyprenyl-3-methyl-5-hydroxy-6-metoxy-1,4-benzoquinol methylase